MTMLLLIQDHWHSSHLQRLPYSELLRIAACTTMKASLSMCFPKAWLHNYATTPRTFCLLWLLSQAHI